MDRHVDRRRNRGKKNTEEKVKKINFLTPNLQLQRKK